MILPASPIERLRALNITENTVKTHAKSIYSKYDVRSRARLISILLRGEDL